MAIQQHPLPQDISSYRFRLIGDMTIKQFGMLAGGIIGAVIINSTPIPFFFKYPLAFVSLAIGIGSAFVPIQGRPLDQWILAFIKSIYSPTQYIWKQSEGINDVHTITKPTTVQEAIKSPVLPKVQDQIAQAAPVAPPQTISEAAPAPTPTTKVEEISQTAPVQTESVLSRTNKTEAIIMETKAEESIPVAAPSKPQSEVQSQSPAPSVNLPIPFTPTTPNTLVGLTLTPDNKILDSVLVEILAQGLTIRATKSNRLGQFMFARPLEDGLYQISAEKEGHKFTAYSLELKGGIVRPLKIQAES